MHPLTINLNLIGGLAMNLDHSEYSREIAKPLMRLRRYARRYESCIYRSATERREYCGAIATRGDGQMLDVRRYQQRRCLHEWTIKTMSLQKTLERRAPDVHSTRAQYLRR
jgi:hypothetical protein